MRLNKQKVKGNMYNHKLPEIGNLKSLYFDKKLSNREISRLFNVTPSAVKNKLNRYNIKLRSLSEGQNLIANHIHLSKEAVIYLDGLLLGDGSLIFSTNKKSVSYKHSDKRKEYLVYLRTKLLSFKIESLQIYKDNRGYFHLQTRSYRELVILRKRWYPNNKKSIPQDLILLPETLKNWYIGDGSLDNKSISEKVTIANDSKVINRKNLIIAIHNIGIKISIYENCFYIKKESRNKFFRYMLMDDNFIPECYQYKFPKELICH